MFRVLVVRLNEGLVAGILVDELGSAVFHYQVHEGRIELDVVDDVAVLDGGVEGLGVIGFVVFVGDEIVEEEDVGYEVSKSDFDGRKLEDLAKNL